MRSARCAIALLALMAPAATIGADMAVTRTVQTVTADAVTGSMARILPGTIVEYSITVANQRSVLAVPVRSLAIEEKIPETVLMVLKPLGTDGSPIQFEDGSLLGTGLLPSGATFGFAALGSLTDSVDFSDGKSWSYVPTPDSAGYDPALRAIRVRLGGTPLAGRSFRLRYRALVP